MSFLRTFARKLIRLALWPIGKLVAWPVRRHLRAFEAATHEPGAIQDALLNRILTRATGTKFGRDHHFSEVRSLADFRRHVPVAGYERVEPYINRMLKGEFDALVPDAVHMFALTSGTTAQRKYIPVTDQYLADYRRGWNIWGLKVFRDHQKVRFRPIVQLSGDCDEFRTEAGTPCGAVTGLTARMQKRFIRWLYCVPPDVGRLKDAAAKNYLVMRLSVPRPVGMVIAANPSSLINLARAADRDKETLIRDIHDGTLSLRFDIPLAIRSAVAHRIRRSPSRARELEEIVRRTGTLYPKDFWPRECILGNWMGGSMGAYLRHYPTYYGDVPVRDVGLIASEGRMTIPLTTGTPAGVLDVTSHFFEFIPEAEGDSTQPTVLRADEIVEGRNYYILLTTAFGLYRYNIHDVVRVTGFHNKTPIVEFLSKGAHFANLTGEKLSEYHVTAAMQGALREMNLTLTSYSLAPCWPNNGQDDLTPYYGLFVERSDFAGVDTGLHLARLLDRQLANVNMEYAAKRDSLRLGPIRLQLLPAGAWHEWDRQRLARNGGSAEQYKHPCLIADPKFRETVCVEELACTACR